MLCCRFPGLVDEWYRDADTLVRAVAGDANGPLMEDLLHAGKYRDPASVEQLRVGADMGGPLQASGVAHAMIDHIGNASFAIPGIGQPLEAQAAVSFEALRADCRRRNKVLVGRLHEDPHAAKLLEITKEDAALGTQLAFQVRQYRMCAAAVQAACCRQSPSPAQTQTAFCCNHGPSSFRHPLQR